MIREAAATEFQVSSSDVDFEHGAYEVAAAVGFLEGGAATSGEGRGIDACGRGTCCFSF